MYFSILISTSIIKFTWIKQLYIYFLHWITYIKTQKGEKVWDENGISNPCTGKEKKYITNLSHFSDILITDDSKSFR